MTKYGDLPVVNYRGFRVAGPELPKCGETALIHDHTGVDKAGSSKLCHCGKRVSVFVGKPASRFHWCLACF